MIRKSFRFRKYTWEISCQTSDERSYNMYIVHSAPGTERLVFYPFSITSNQSLSSTLAMYMLEATGLEVQGISDGKSGREVQRRLEKNNNSTPIDHSISKTPMTQRTQRWSP